MKFLEFRLFWWATTDSLIFRSGTPPNGNANPIAMAERMTVRPGGRRTGGGADMGEKQSCADLFGKVAQIFVIPGRMDIAEHAGVGVIGIPANAKPVAIGDRPAALGAQALLDQRVLRFEQNGIEAKRGSAIGKPTAHKILFVG